MKLQNFYKGFGTSISLLSEGHGGMISPRHSIREEADEVIRITLVAPTVPANHFFVHFEPGHLIYGIRKTIKGISVSHYVQYIPIPYFVKLEHVPIQCQQDGLLKISVYINMARNDTY